MNFYIKKSSGEKEKFNIHKFKNSLQKAGANRSTINDIVNAIKGKEFRDTKEVHEFAIELLNKKNKATAARYNIKHALMQLGPSGFPFENFVAQIFKEQGYKTNLDEIIPGKCVDHEIDVCAHKNNKEHIMIECKYHNKRGDKTDVKVTLYVYARFDDVRNQWKSDPEHAKEIHAAYLATNTRFTTEAIKYAECIGLKLLGWSYPQNDSLENLIDRFDLYPITVLTLLNKKQIRELMSHGLVLCRDIENYIKILKKLGLSGNEVSEVIVQAKGVCAGNMP